MRVKNAPGLLRKWWTRYQVIEQGMEDACIESRGLKAIKKERRYFHLFEARLIWVNSTRLVKKFVAEGIERRRPRQQLCTQDW